MIELTTVRDPEGVLHAVASTDLARPVDLPEDVEWTSAYEGWEVVCEGLPLSMLQADRLERVKAAQAARFARGWTHEFSVGTHTLDLRDADDKTNWTLLLIKTQAMIAAGYAAAPVTLRTANNEEISIPASETFSAMQQFLAWGEAMLVKKWGLDAEIRAATLETIETIDIEAGWPA